MNQLIRSVVEPEIIAPGDLVDIYVRPSPFREQRHHFRLTAGLTLAEMIDRCAEPAGLHPEKSALNVSINGHKVPRKNWSRVRVKPGFTINVIAVPRGKAIGKILGAIVALVAAVVAPYIASAFFAVGTTAFSVATGLIGAGLPICGEVRTNSLLPSE